MASARDIRIDRQRDRSKLKYVIALPFGISNKTRIARRKFKMNANSLLRAASLLAVMPILGMAQVGPNSDPVVLKHWAAPLYWQPRAAGAGSQALDPNPLVFVAMTPCRVVDTRASQGFPPAFGPPSLVAGASRTFPVQSSASCPIPAAAQAYSFNVTAVPAGPSGFITAYPTGQPLPLAATLVWSGGALTSNAAVVPAGTNGSIDVYANVATDIVIDINGYYAPASFGTNTNQAAAGNGATCTLGEIILSAGSVANGTPANGQILSIAQNTALFSLLGTLYGGNGQTTFALPDLRAAAPNGLTYSICDQGVFPSRR
jgi:hypothetical protein